MAIESFKKAQREHKVEEYKNIPEATPPSVEEILGDKTYSNLMAKVLERKLIEAENNQGDHQGLEELSRKVLSGETLNEDELNNLIEYRTKVKEAVDQSKEAYGLISQEGGVEYLASLSPEFNKIIQLVGKDKAERLLKDYLASVYVEDPERFKQLSQQIENVNTRRKELEKLDKEITQLANQYNISKDEINRFYELLATTKPEDAEDYLRQVVKKHMIWIDRFKDRSRWLLGAGGEIAEQRIQQLNRIEEVRALLEGKIIGNDQLIYENLTNNKNLRELLGIEIVEERGVQKLKLGEVTYENNNFSNLINALTERGVLVKLDGDNYRINGVNQHLGEIGKMIENAFFQTEEGRKSLSEALREKVVPIKERAGVMNFAEAGQELKDLQDRNTLEKAWKKFVSERKIDFSKVEIKNIQNQFKEYLKQKRDKRGSWFELIFKLADDSINQFISGEQSSSQ
ncbi:MAG: hypothetical protein KatS3mg095_0451 [Candidatus Parcubacteria bacterium]|nr:MAG: hypothetical protein KatS3mg095_0451 [Candidatus Parcubacteria bacterium]